MHAHQPCTSKISNNRKHFAREQNEKLAREEDSALIFLEGPEIVRKSGLKNVRGGVNICLSSSLEKHFLKMIIGSMIKSSKFAKKSKC